MRSEMFHKPSDKKSPLVVDEASRLSIQGTEEVNVYQVDDNGDKVKLLSSGKTMKLKLHDVNEIVMESKGCFNSIIEGPDKLDNTPIEVPIEKPLTQTQQLKQWLQNEENMRSFARHELTWSDFKDLGNMDDSDEFYERFGQPNMTKSEMQAEALRQEMNPLRANPISELQEKQGNIGGETVDESPNTNDTQSNTSTHLDGVPGQTNNETQPET